MNSRPITPALVICAMITVTYAAAQTPTSASGGISLDTYLKSGDRIFSMADKNRDGRISEAESAALKRARETIGKISALMLLDVNGDGGLSRRELSNPWAKPAAPSGADKGVGSVVTFDSKAKFDDSLKRRFKDFDQNGNGYLLYDEVQFGELY